MPQYFSPGVYIQEVETGPVPIQGVATSITGAVGVTLQGPTSGSPILVTSFNDFQNTFGGFIPMPTADVVATWGGNNPEGGNWWQFPLAVKGYFDNGGQQLYVKRVFSSTAVAASVMFGAGLVSELTKNAATGATSLTLRQLFGIENGTTLSIDGLSTNQNTVVSYDPVGLTVALKSPTAAALTSASDYVAVNIPTAAPTAQNATLIFTAQELGAWGNALSVRVRPILGATTTIAPNALTPRAAFVTSLVSVVVSSTWTVTIATTTPAIDPTKPVTIGATTYTPQTGSTSTSLVLTGVPIAAGVAWQGGNTQLSQTTPGTGGGSPTTVTTTITASVGSGTFTTTPGQPSPLQNGDHVLIGASRVVIDQVEPTNTFTAGTATPVAASWSNWVPGTRVQLLRKARAPGTVVDVADGSQLYQTALVEFDNGTQKEINTVASVTGNAVTLSTALSNQYYELDTVRVIEAEVAVQLTSNGTVTQQELFSGLQLTPSTDPSYLVNYVNNQSALVNVQAGPGLLSGSSTVFNSLSNFPTAPNGGWWPLAGGADNMNQLSVYDFVGVDGGSGHRTGIQALEDIDNVSICVVPGMWSTTIQSALVTFCETLADRFAILDPPDGLSIAGIQAFRAPYDSEYAALYYPWLVLLDPSTQLNVNVAPSAHMAGIYAQTDNNRGVFKAPANVPVAGIIQFAANVVQREQDVLNPIGINALRFFTNRGYLVWGARTLSSDTNWQYINVRRIFIYVEKSIQQGTQWVVFEPNDESTWSRVRQSVTNFLTTFWQSGGLQGTTAAQAFFVACDLGVTMTQDDIDNGRMIVQVGIAPVKPAEFVIFQIMQYTQGSTTS